MRRSRLGITLGLSLFLVGSVQAQTAKVGYIDSNAILAQYPMAQEAQRTMEASLQSYQAEMQQLTADMQAAVEEFQQQQLTMTDEARKNREEQLQTQQRAIQQRAAELDDQAQRRQAEVFQPVMSAITEIIEQIRVEGSYAMIFDVASQSILSADPALDLTQEVLNRLQAEADPAQG